MLIHTAVWDEKLISKCKVVVGVEQILQIKSRVFSFGAEIVIASILHFVARTDFAD